MVKDNLKPSEKYMLVITEAAAYFNIGVKKMRRMAENNEGDLAVYFGNKYLIIRPKLEEYLLETAERKGNKYAQSRAEE